MKVINLLSIITNKEKFVDNLMEHTIELGDLKVEPTKEEFNVDNITRYAKVELAMSYFHCLETFIRLFIAHAKLSGCPWLELAKLSIAKYKEELQKISEGKFNHFNSRISDNETILYVFTGHTKPEGEITEELIDGYKTWLSFAATQLLETYDYNSFKHGLAISPRMNGLSIGKQGSEFKIEKHGEVLEHLTRMKSGERQIWAKQVNFISYDKKATFVLIVEELITNILDIGRMDYLDVGEEIRVFKAHEFLPEKILHTDEKQPIQVDSFRKGLLYYK